MTAKFIVFSLLVASVCGSGGYSSFSYGVSDPNTGDVKDQHEKRVGDSVIGKYSLLESDGTKRIVDYEANAATGFKAVVRKEPPIGVHPSGPQGLGPLVAPANGSVSPAQPTPISSANVTPIAPAHAAPLAPAHAVPSAAVGPHAPKGQNSYVGNLSHSGALLHPGALPHPSIHLHPDTLPHPGSYPHPAQPNISPIAPFSAFHFLDSSFHPNPQGHLGSLPIQGALANNGVFGLKTPLIQSGALSHQAVFAHHQALSHRGVLSPSGAIGSLSHPTGITHPSPVNPNHLAGNFVGPEYTPFAGVNGYGAPVSGPQGVPAVSHFSHSVVHEANRIYPGLNAFGYNGGAFTRYGDAHRGYGARGYVGSFTGPLAHGPASGPLGAAHSYASITRGEAYNNGYGGYGSRFNGVYGTGVNTGLGW